LYFESLLPDRSSVVRLEVAEDGSSQPVGKAVIRSARSDSGAVRAPDGTLAWVSDRSGIAQLWIREPGGPDRQLTDVRAPRRFSSLAFSPDGGRVLAIVDGGTGSIDRAGTQFTPHSAEGDDVIDASWSPDGEAVYFVRRGDSETAWMKIGAQAPPADARSILSGVVTGRVRADGALLWFDAAGFWIETPGEAPRLLAALPAPDHWWVDDDSAWLVREGTLTQLDPSTGETRPVLALDPLDTSTVAPMGDGTFLVTRYQARESDILLEERAE